MSNSRQYSRQAADEPVVRGYAVTHPAGSARVRIQDGWDQLLYTASGVLTIRSNGGVWTIPPDRALWIPAGEPVIMSGRRPVAVRALYLPADGDVVAASGRMRALALPRFGRELLLHMVTRCPLYDHRPVDRALRTVLVDQVAQWADAPLGLPIPRDPRARAFVDALTAGAAEPIRIGASTRTQERLFLAETGISLGAWRRRATVLASLDTLLATGSVTDAAMAAGYGTPSSYITAFSSDLRATPGSYLRASAL
jgi:hypothetical protein